MLTHSAAASDNIDYVFFESTDLKTHFQPHGNTINFSERYWNNTSIGHFVDKVKVKKRFMPLNNAKKIERLVGFFLNCHVV